MTSVPDIVISAGGAAAAGDGAAKTAVTGYDTMVGLTEGTDVMSFDEDMISGSLGNKAITVLESGGVVDLNTANNIGVFIIDETVTTPADGLSVLATEITAEVQNPAASDAFIFIVDDDTTTFVVHWDDRAANGGDGGGDIDAAELQILAIFTEGDAHGAGYEATGDFTTY